MPYCAQPQQAAATPQPGGCSHPVAAPAVALADPQGLPAAPAGSTMRPAMGPRALNSTTWMIAVLLAGCATRAVDVQPLAANPADFAGWDCTRIDDETDAVQQRAADVAYSVDQRAGNNILALGVGVTVFWPAILAMRPDGLDAAELARLKGRFEALMAAARNKGCPPPAEDLPAARAAALPVAVGELLVYEERNGGRGPATESTLRVSALRRGEIEYRRLGAAAGAEGPWRQDRNGNVTQAPTGALQWPHLLRGELVLGAVTGGDITVVGEPQARARIRGQVVAVGPQNVNGRRFDAAVVELFGDAPRGDETTRVEGVLVVDRISGVLLELELRSARGSFSMQRRLLRVDRQGAATPR